MLVSAGHLFLSIHVPCIHNIPTAVQCGQVCTERDLTLLFELACTDLLIVGTSTSVPLLNFNTADGAVTEGSWPAEDNTATSGLMEDSPSSAVLVVALPCSVFFWAAPNASFKSLQSVMPWFFLHFKLQELRNTLKKYWCCFAHASRSESRRPRHNRKLYGGRKLLYATAS